MRDDVLHKLTTRIANCYRMELGIEDLNLKGFLKNRRLSRSLPLDPALGKLLTLLTRKVEQRGGQVIAVGRFFPSSKSCRTLRVEMGRHGVV